MLEELPEQNTEKTTKIVVDAEALFIEGDITFFLHVPLASPSILGELVAKTPAYKV